MTFTASTDTIKTRIDANSKGVIPLTEKLDNIDDNIRFGMSQDNVKYNGAVGDGIADDTDVLQTLFDSISASKQNRTAIIPSGTYRITSQLTIDVRYVSILGLSAKIDASAITSGNALLFVNTSSSPYYQSTQFIQGLELIGNSKTGTVVAMKLQGTSAPGAVSHITFRNMNIHDFGTGVYFGSYSYVNDFSGVDIWNCSLCLYIPSGGDDYGERLTFWGCTFYNSVLAIKCANDLGAFHLTNCSLDYCQKLVEITSGKVFLTSCHLEGGDYASSPITLTGSDSTFIMRDGWLLASTEIPPAHGFSSTIDNDGDFALFDGVFMNNMQSNTDYFAEGSGRTIVRNTSSYGIRKNSKFLSVNDNLMIDGGFEDTSITDLVYITGDTAAITSRTVGTNINLTLDATAYHSGSKSLKVAKASGAGTLCDFVIAAPVTPGSMPNIKFWYKKSGTETGDMTKTYYFARLDYNASGLPILRNILARDAVTVNFTSDPVDWHMTSSSEPLMRTPAGATHLVLKISLYNFVGPGAIYIDDVEVSEV